MITWLGFSLSQLSNLLLIIITAAKVVLIQTISLWTFSSSRFVNKSKYFGRIVMAWERPFMTESAHNPEKDHYHCYL